MVGTARFTLGEVEVVAIQDSELTPLPRDFFPGIEPIDEVELTRESGRDGRLRVPVMVYVIRSEDGVTLVDTGVGPHPFVEAPAAGLPAALEEQGIARDRVDRVVFTHLHPDHIGGTVDAAGGPAFPNAVHTVVRGEWEFWSDPLWRTPEWSWVGNSLGGALRPLAAGSVELRLADPGARISRGLRLVPLPGHTPCHTGLALEGTGGEALFIGDALHHALQFRNLHWSFRHDADPARAIETRAHVVHLSRADHVRLFGGHISFLGIVEARASE
jgi:glyoxylase-like metal-dependent hydrolase (beta-lactamase superfamily II)